MLPTILAVAGVLTVLTLWSGGSPPTTAHRPPPGTPDDEAVWGPPGDPSEAAEAILDEFVAQSEPRNRTKLAKLLRERLTTRIDDTTVQIAMPCDYGTAPSFDRVAEIGLAIGEAYRVPVRADRVEVGKYPFAVLSVGPHPATPDLSHLEREEMGGVGLGARGSGSTAHRPLPTAHFGGILDLVFRSVVASAVGTVTSMGVQDLVHSMGGERRLARIMRHYRTAVARGDEEKAERIREKVTRSASRIKGRRVDWSEVEELMAKG